MCVLLPHRYASLAYPNICASCGPTAAPLAETHLGMVCRRPCAECEDWLLGESVTENGKEYHPACAAVPECHRSPTIEEIVPYDRVITTQKLAGVLDNQGEALAFFGRKDLRRQ
jgi:hypothetical protein